MYTSIIIVITCIAINIIAINVVIILIIMQWCHHLNHRQTPLSILPWEMPPVCSTLKTRLVFIITIIVFLFIFRIIVIIIILIFIFILYHQLSPKRVASSLFDLEDEACFRNFQSRADIHQNSLNRGNMCSIISTMKVIDGHFCTSEYRAYNQTDF